LYCVFAVTTEETLSRQLLKEVYQLHNKDDLMDLKSAQSYADFPLSPAPPHFVVGIAYRKMPIRRQRNISSLPPVSGRTFNRGPVKQSKPS